MQLQKIAELAVAMPRQDRSLGKLEHLLSMLGDYRSCSV